MAQQISKKHKAIQDGIFKAELNNFLMKELAEDGYSGVEVRRAPARTECIILATRTQNVLGERGRRIRELTAVVQKRFGGSVGTVEVSQLSAFRPAHRSVVSALCREGWKPWSLRRRPMRVPPLQVDRWSCCSPCLLWCPPLHHGIWCPRM